MKSKSSKMVTKRIMSIILSFVMVFSLMNGLVLVEKAEAATNPYPVDNYDSTGEWSNCTWSVWKLVYENLGIELPDWGWAGQSWIDGAKNAGYTTGSEPRLNSIVVFNGHVAFVTNVSADRSQFYIKEGGYGYAPNRNYNERWVATNRNDILGYIYLSKNSSNINVGDDFYAYIINTSTWLHLTNDSNNVSVRKETGKANQVWHFLRQGDGSYKIVNCHDEKVLDVSNAGNTDGTNVGVWFSNDSDAQRWYIYGESAAYTLSPKCANKNLDVYGNSDQEGANVQIFTVNDTPAQKFQIWKLNTPAASILTCSVGTTQKDTVFTWTKASDTKWYDIKIWNGTCWVGDAYKIQWGETDTQWSVRLPEGYYEAYVDSCNNFAGTMSNIVKFTVKYEEPQSTNSSPTSKSTPKPSPSSSPSHTHVKKTKITPATFEEDGERVEFCATCNKIISSETIYAISDIWIDDEEYVFSKAKVNVVPKVNVLDREGNEISKKYYSIVYPDKSYKVRDYSIEIEFNGEYDGFESLYFTILPRPTKIVKLKASYKAIKVKWKQKTVQSTGYQIQYSSSKKFKNKKTIIIDKDTTTEKTIKKLISKKKYYIRVRTVCKFGGEKYYSRWSKKRSIKTK